MLISILTLLAVHTEVCKVLNLTIANSAKHLCAVHVRSSVDNAVILGVPVFPGPTLIEILNY